MNSFLLMDQTALLRRKKLTIFALILVWIGGTIGIFAAFVSLYLNNYFEVTTLVISILALVASIPVYPQYRSITQILATQNQRQ